MNMILIFDMHDVKGALFSKAIICIGAFSSYFPFTTMYASPKSHKFDFSIGVLNLIFLYIEHCSFDKLFTLISFLVKNFGTDEVESFNNLDIF